MGRTILITGASGFLGTNLSRALLQLGFRVIGLDCRPYPTREAENKNFTFVKGDVRDVALLATAARDVDVIVHFAELRSMDGKHLVDVLETNVVGTEAVMAVARDAKAKVIVGSSEDVLGASSNARITEESFSILRDANCPESCHAVSKLMAEHLALACGEEYGISTTILRFFGGTGPFQHNELTPGNSLIAAAVSRAPQVVSGDGQELRSFTGVNDMVDATILAIESSLVTGEVIHIAGDESITTVNLAFLAWRLCNPNRPMAMEFKPVSQPPGDLVTDINKAKALLGYKPKVGLEDGIHTTIEWLMNEDQETLDRGTRA